MYGVETVWRVPSLSTPDPNTVHSSADINTYEAVKLFIDRAKSVVAAFVVPESDTSTLVEICHTLDGIPLAIELAASRVRVLSLRDIRRRLNDRFRLLTGGSRTGLPRQQT